MTRRQSGKVCVPATSCLGLQSATLSTEADRADGDGGGTDFCVVESFRRLRIRYEKRADIHEAFLVLGCVLICWNFLSYEEILRRSFIYRRRPNRPHDVPTREAGAEDAFFRRPELLGYC